MSTIEYVPHAITANHLEATFVPERLDPSTDPESPELQLTWYCGTPGDWFRVNDHDPKMAVRSSWHHDEDHLTLGHAHLQYSTDVEADR